MGTAGDNAAVTMPPSPASGGPDSAREAASAWPQVRQLFEDARALEGSARERLLADPAHPAALVAEVRALLAADAALATDFLERPAASGTAALGTAAAPPALAPGQRLGPWRLVAPLGRGGMGEVWEAARDDGQFQGRAAIKLLHPGLDSAAVLARFAQERQALARLSHPHIARLFDAGATPAGAPFVVMELVDGQPIDRACEGLPIAARLQRFLQLADAVAYAHRQLLVHRDLKPGNVLVDREGQVKLLDFGIAKALDPAEGDAGSTQGGERPFTPLFASPEQVRGEPVSTATDIYSLGVLLYVLLTGQRPYGRSVSTAAAAARSVLEEAPTRPSSLRLPDAGWERTRRQLQGDLDKVLLKALAKDTAERYASVDALAGDVRAWLEGRPVSARAATPWYVTARFLARHRTAALAAALGLLGLATGLAATLLQGRVVLALGATGLASGLVLALVQTRRAQLARGDAEHSRDQVREQLQAVQRITSELVFRFGDTITYMPGGATAQDALLGQVQAVLEPLALRHAGNDELQALLASVLSRRGQLRCDDTLGGSADAWREGEALLARSLAIGDRLWPRQHRDWRFADAHSRAQWALANRWQKVGRDAEAEQMSHRIIAGLHEALPHAQADRTGRYVLGVQLANNIMGLAMALRYTRPNEALALLEQAEPTLRTMLADRAWQQALDATQAPGEIPVGEYVRHQLGTLLAVRATTRLRLDDPAAARSVLEEALLLRRANVAASPDNLAWRDGLCRELLLEATACLRLGNAGAALPCSREAWEIVCEGVARPESAAKWAGLLHHAGPVHARALWACGEHSAAQAVLEQALDAGRLQPPGTQPGRFRQAQLLALQGVLDGREAPLREALRLLQALQEDPTLARAACLEAAEARSWLATLGVADADGLRRSAATALREAAAQQPLGPDHQLLLAQLPG